MTSPYFLLTRVFQGVQIMLNINDQISKELYNEYDGSEKKKTVILKDGQKYLLKLADPVREKNACLSYINNAYSEYIGCKIAKSIGLPVQDVLLGEYTYIGHNGQTVTRPACLCKDLRRPGEQMIKLETVALGFDLNDNSSKITFESQNELFSKIDGIDTEIFKSFYADQFILDALIGNTDRHNGNVSILVNDESARICPIYDCGSSLLPTLNDDEITESNFLTICSVISDKNGRINYTDFFANKSNPDIDNALLRIISKINLPQIDDIISNTDGLSDKRKEIYKDFLHTRYQKILVPALERIFDIDNVKQDSGLSSAELFLFYKANIAPFAKIAIGDKVHLHDSQTDVMKISNKYAIVINNGLCTCLLPIRSNNNEIRKLISILNLGKPISQQYNSTLPEIKNDKINNDFDDTER